MRAYFLCFILAASGLTITSPLHAQLDPELAAMNAEDGSDPDGTEGEFADEFADEGATEEAEQAPAPETDEDAEARRAARKLKLSPGEEPDTNYFFLGVQMRGMIMPKFLLGAFLAENPRVADWATGVDFTYRRNKFDAVASVWWAGYRFNGPVRNKNDPDSDTEWIDSNWSMLMTTVSFLWEAELHEQVSLQFGPEVGLGWLLGSLYRSEAVPDGNGGWRACDSALNPPTLSNNFDPTTGAQIPYCDVPANPIPGQVPATDQDTENGAHYNVKQRRWAEGGNAPNLIPWIAVRGSLRYKPIKQIMTRADLGIGLGVYLGLSAAYGF